MSTPTPKPHHLARAVVSNPDRIQEWAAWELLHAVRELFSERFDDLRVIGEDFEWDLKMDPESVDCTADDLNNPKPPDELFYRASSWADKNNIGCLSVYDVAARFAWGLGPSPAWPLSDLFQPLAIHARPEDETRDEFLARAGKHYDDMATILLSAGAGGRFKKGPIKREHDHFRYLAVFLIGGKTWEQIARAQKPLVKHAKTIAEGARHAARLIGMPMPNNPGPRPGSRLRKAEHRVQRSKR
jgi:hypothetical protein